MRLMPFAKIFEVGEGQVLIYKEYDADCDKYNIVQLISVAEGPDLKVSLAFKQQVNRDNLFNSYGLEKAEQFVKSIALLV